MTTRQYRSRTKHQNGASITSGSTSLTVGALLQGQGLSGASFPYTVAVYAQDGSGNQTSYEVMNVTGGTYPTLTVTRGIDDTTPVAHDTTHIIAQVVGTIDLNNFLQSGAAGLSQFSWLLKTANYSVTTSDTGILADATGGNVTVTLPTAVGATQLYAIARKDASANTITIATTSSQTIDGFSSIPLVAQDQAVLLASDNANWFIVSSYYPSPLTTKGDLLVADGSGIAQRLGVSGGSNGWALVLDSTQPLGVKWVALAGSSTLAGDTDVSISSPANLDQLQYQTGDSKFHNVSGGMVKLAETLLGSTTASVTFSSIPSGYRHLRLEWFALGTNLRVGLLLRFNGDSGANYDWQTTAVTASTVGGTLSSAQTGISLGVLPGVNDVGSSIFNPGVVDIPYYTNTFAQKAIVAAASRKDANTSSIYTYQTAGAWRTTGSAITSITLIPAADSLAANSLFTLYGIV